MHRMLALSEWHGGTTHEGFTQLQKMLQTSTLQHISLSGAAATGVSDSTLHESIFFHKRYNFQQSPDINCVHKGSRFHESPNLDNCGCHEISVALIRCAQSKQEFRAFGRRSLGVRSDTDADPPLLRHKAHFHRQTGHLSQRAPQANRGRRIYVAGSPLWW